MKYIVFDLEATCWNQRDKSPNETIEIGALLINEAGKIASEFNTFIQPIKHPTLSEFCTELTSIEQKDVDTAPYFYDAIESFKTWFDCASEDYLLCSWGFYDRKQLESDCEISHLNSDWVQKHISIKHQHQKIKKLRRAVGMKHALKLDGFSLEGTHHRGIDDARNIAKIFLKYFDQWEY